MLQLARAFLERKGLEEARLEAELLVAHALGLDRLGLFMQLDRPLSGEEIDRARDLLVRRGKREPVAYITGRREFYGRDFEVGPGVLIPRPETELIVDLVRERLAAREEQGPASIADLGCGSGCLAVTLALEVPNARVVASDLCAQAVARTRSNAERLGALVEVIEGDGAAPLLVHGPFDFLVSNPPYIARGEAAQLSLEVRDFEPELALYAPENDPDHWAAVLIRSVPQLLNPGGHLLVELGHEQGSRVLDLARSSGLVASLHEDLQRIPRVLKVQRG
jgi:release factor glutamine methyltransferase